MLFTGCEGRQPPKHQTHILRVEANNRGLGIAVPVRAVWFRDVGMRSRQVIPAAARDGDTGKAYKVGSSSAALAIANGLGNVIGARNSHLAAKTKMVSIKALVAAAVQVVSLPSLAQARGQVKTPAAPGLTFLYSLNCTLAPPIPVGGGPHGTRLVIPIVGGTFSGPRLSGRCSS